MRRYQRAPARFKKAPAALQPFQRFGWERPDASGLKRLGPLAAYVHRAEAAVLMSCKKSEPSGALALLMDELICEIKKNL